RLPDSVPGKLLQLCPIHRDRPPRRQSAPDQVAFMVADSPASALKRKLYSNSTSTCPPCTKSPTLALILATLPAIGAVITVSIFIASSTRRGSLAWIVCPTWAAMRETVPAQGLRQTLLSLATGAVLGRTGGGALGA